MIVKFYIKFDKIIEIMLRIFYNVFIQNREVVMEDVICECGGLDKISARITYKVLKNEDDILNYCHEIPYINVQTFLNICKLYKFPITVICQKQYIDKMYRDAYYIYLSHLHFDMERNCQRLALFSGNISFESFFDYDCHAKLQEQFLGTIVVRPSYNYSTEYTIGRTLLNPYKMKNNFKYIRTTKYKVTICGQTYSVDAFPFSNQHGDVLRCAETSVWALMEYYGTHYENYSVVMPSTISNWTSKELPERSLPSEGLTYSQISSLLKTFNFEPRIYERIAYDDKIKISRDQFVKQLLEGRDFKGLLRIELEENTEEIISNDTLDLLNVDQIEIEAEKLAQKIDDEIKDILKKEQDKREKKVKETGELRQVSLQNLFHYYVESGIPLITAVCNTREEIHHSIVIIGHEERSPYRQSREYIQTQSFQYGNLNIIDSSVLYERYITVDDNQYPYRSEKFDHFSISQNCKVEAFIVPLYRHIMLDAESAVSIIETVYRDSNNLIQSTLEQLEEEEEGCQGNSIDNPVVLRYYLTTSRSFVEFRNRDTEYMEEKLFYDTTTFPKFVWVGEYSTLELYRQGKILGEIIVDATAPKYSGMGAIIAMRFGGRCASRQTNEPPEILQQKLCDLKEQQARLIYSLYVKNLQKGDLEKC